MSERSASELWSEGSPLPVLSGTALDAEKLVTLVHLGTDFTVWGGKRRMRYWDALTERVRAATYSGPTLVSWWGNISADLVSSPKNEQERLELAQLLGQGNDREVLKYLRNDGAVLVMRVRVISEMRKNARNAGEVF